ncbi:MAG TPA: 2-amino-4-hydroxy-6-hydroxymethyldihydropteridine diphosphokinase [Methylophilaceae bacterium]|nr:2-amino-4-hydroxy-6-hydroxymethyldihydropteridine diphosphokinase [Methylophilaceae bacterium]
MHKAYIALGSNLQQPQQQVLQAFRELSQLPATRLVRQSSLYRTAPLDQHNRRHDEQPDFINAVAEIATEMPPLALLHAILAIEDRHGRERPFPNAPRVLDMDLLLYDNLQTHSVELTLPHPRMHERGFVLLPLAEIAPELAIPCRGNVAELAQACSAQGVVKIND